MIGGLRCIQSHDKRKRTVVDYTEFEKSEKVGLGDGKNVEAVGVGNIHMNMLMKESELYSTVYYMYQNLLVTCFHSELLQLKAMLSNLVDQSAGFTIEMESLGEWVHLWINCID